MGSALQDVDDDAGSVEVDVAVAVESDVASTGTSLPPPLQAGNIRAVAIVDRVRFNSFMVILLK